MAEAIGAFAGWVGSWAGGAASAAAGGGIGGAAVGGVVGAVAYGVAYVGAYAALSYGIAALTAPDAGPGLQGQELSFVADTRAPRQMIVGRRLVSGSMVAHYEAGNQGYRLHLVIALADHPVQGCARLVADGRVVLADLVHGVRTAVPGYDTDRDEDTFFVTFYDGRPGQTADANLIAESLLDADVQAGRKNAWTADHVGAGVAYAHVELVWHQSRMNSPPQLQWEIDGAKIYNRRKDATAGGSGAHRIDNPSTWEFSTNVADIAAHFLQGYQVAGDRYAFGVGLLPEEIPYAAYAAAADLCDEDITVGVGGAAATLTRYAANGVIQADVPFETVIEELQVQMAARVVDFGGRIGFLPAVERTPVVSLTDGDQISADSVRFHDKRRFSDLVGAVAGNFSDATKLYRPEPYERQVAPEAELADGGEASTRTINLPFETDARRAARIASIWLERERRQATLAGTFNQAAWALEPGDWFSYTSPHEQLEDELFEVIDIVKHADMTCTITAQAVDADIVAYDNDNDPVLSEPLYIAPLDLSISQPSFSVASSTIVGGGATEPALQFTLTGYDAAIREILVEWRRWDPSGAGAFTGPSKFETLHSDQALTWLRAGILPGVQYRVRAKAKAGVKESDWTNWTAPISTGSTYFVTSAGVASSIVGQAPAATDSTIQPGATRNQLTRSSTAPSSPANGDIWIDTTSNPFIIKTRVAGAWENSGSYGGVFGGTLYTSQGGAVATLAAFQTSLGIAAGITGQAPAATDTTIQPGATKNTLTYSASEPGSPTNGDIWIDISTTPYVIKSRVSGAWQASGSYGGIFGSTLYEAGGGAVASLANFKTSLGISAGFTGQGALATRNPSDLLGINVLPNPTGANGNTNFWSYNGNANVQPYNEPTSRGRAFVLSYPNSGGITGQWFSDAIAIDGSAPVAFQAFIDHFNPASGTFSVALACYDALGGYIANANFQSFPSQRFGFFSMLGTTPVGTATIRVVFAWSSLIGAGGGGSVVIRRMKLERGTSVTPYSEEVWFETIQRGADVTNQNIAQGITGQGQGATANWYEQETDPGSVPNGSTWYKPSTREVRIRVGGAWSLWGVLPSSSQVLTDAEKTKTGTANYGSTALTSGTFTTVATIDLSGVGAGGFLNMQGTTLGVNLSGTTVSSGDGTSFFGEWRVTEQPQAGGTETVVWSGSFQVDDTGTFVDMAVDFIAPATRVANVNAGAVRYRLQARRASGTNTLGGNSIGGVFQIQRTP
jgi:hypothetical protein